ncbi:MAG TPA: hypothetical protein PL056_10975 [bacterium]|jgi:hypothetical protein|nr:hypothetical protein [bacterium]
MKKSIRPPENWQDFESLCKKLFGEVWGCPYTIKKNGRLGQPQAGVDVYGKPKGEENYWAIQCKGKDNYTNSKLTKNEIDEEIEKALTFEPKIKVYALATTATKDAEIEKYVRIKDIESAKKGGFEIILYSWEDIADLIEEHRDTFNWYVNNLQFKEQFDIEVSFQTENDKNILTPKFQKTITTYTQKPELELQTSKPILGYATRSLVHPITSLDNSIFGPKKKNHGWCTLKVRIFNSGNKVLEDWKFWLSFDEESVKDVDDDFTSNPFAYEVAAKYRTTWAYENEKQILYKPLNNAPLIQKDSKVFECHCIPKFDSTSIKVGWQLLARDFDLEGVAEFEVVPEYEIARKRKYVDNSEEVREETEISDYVTTIEKKD